MTDVSYGIAMPSVRGVLSQPPLLPPLDQVTGVTVRGAWSLARPMFARFRDQHRGRARDTITAGEQNFVTPAEAGAFLGANPGAIVSLYDHSGNGRTLTNATAAQQPAFSPNVASTGRAGCVFDATDDKLAGAALSNFISAAAGYAVCVFVYNGLTANNGTFLELNQCVWADGAGIYAGVTGRANGTITASNYDGSSDYATVSGIAAGALFVHEWWHASGVQYGRVNGGTAAAVVSGNTTVLSGALGFGRGYTGCAASNGSLLEAAFMSAVPAQANGIVANMKKFYGIA